MKYKKILIIGSIIIVTPLAILLTMGIVDYRRTTQQFSRPIFAKLDEDSKTDDGGSGTYKGIGYSIEIEGYFPDKPSPPLSGPISGVESARFYVFGKEIYFAERNWIN